MNKQWITAKAAFLLAAATTFLPGCTSFVHPAKGSGDFKQDRLECERYVSTNPRVNRFLGKMGLSGEVLRDIEHAYVAHLRMVDNTVGRIVDRLKTAGLFDESILVVLLDHNTFLGMDEKRPALYGDLCRRRSAEYR